MPADLAIAGGLAAASLLSQGGSAVAQGRMNRSSREFAKEQMWRENEINKENWNAQNQYNMDLWEKQKVYNKSVWEMQNEYDSPAAQMARFKAAGLNPNLVYGNMSGGQNMSVPEATGAGSVPGAHGAVPQGKAPEFDFGGPMMQILSAHQMQLQNQNIEAQTVVNQKEAAIKDATAAGLLLDNSQKAFMYSGEMQKLSADYKRSQLRDLEQKQDYRIHNYNLAAEGLGMKNQQVQQFIKQSNQAISESVARTGSINAGIPLINAKLRTEGFTGDVRMNQVLSEEQKVQIQAIQKAFLSQKMDQAHTELYLKMIQAVLSGGSVMGR